MPDKFASVGKDMYHTKQAACPIMSTFTIVFKEFAWFIAVFEFTETFDNIDLSTDDKTKHKK